MNGPKLREKVVRGVLWLGLGRLLTNAVGFAGTVIIARLLLPVDFGIVAIATAIIALLNGMTAVSPESALIAADKVDYRMINTAWTIAVIRSLLVSLLLAGGCWAIASFYGDDRLRNILLAFAFIFSLSGFANPRLALLQKDLQFHQDFYINLIAKLTSTLVSAATAYFYQSYWALIAGAACAQFSALIFGYIFAPYRPRFTLSYARKVFSFTSWLTLASIISTLNFRIDHLLIGATLGPAAVGKYLVSDELSGMPTRELGAPFTALLFPSLVTVRDDLDKLRAAYLRMQSAIFALLAPAGIGLGLVAYLVVPMIYGPKWTEVVPLVTLLATIYGIQSFQFAALPLAMAVSRPGVMVMRDLVTLLLRVVAMFVGGLAYGIIGVIVGRMVVNVVAIVLSLNAVRMIIGISPARQIIACHRTIISLLLMAVCVIALRYFVLPVLHSEIVLVDAMIAVSLGVLTYTGTLWFIWWAEGMPNGPESTLIELANARLEMFRSR